MMQMPNGALSSIQRWFFVFIILASVFTLLAGCGGGGGGGTTGTTGNVSVKLSTTQTTIAYGQTIVITATVSNSADQTVIYSISPSTSGFTQTGNNSATFTAPSTSQTYTISGMADANNAVVAKVLIHVVPIAVAITPSSVIVSPGATTQFSANVTGTTNSGVTFTASGGKITVINSTSISYQASTTLGTYTITATSLASASAVGTATVTVSSSAGSGSATVNGQIVDSTGADLSGVVVQFYNAAGTQVGQATSVANGQFSASVPTSATSFGLSAASINTNVDYEAYSYNTIRYDPLITGCYVPLQAISNNQTVNLLQIIVASQADPPPAPPNGCP